MAGLAVDVVADGGEELVAGVDMSKDYGSTRCFRHE